MKFESDVKTGFPSEHLDPKIKQTAEWCLQFTKAAHEATDKGLNSGLFRNSASLYKEWREYARGEQDIAIYDPILGIKTKNGGTNNKSWRSINREILPVAKKYKEIVMGKILNRNNDLMVKPIDPGSAEEERLKKNMMKEEVINRSAIEQMKSMGFNPGPEVSDGMPKAESVEEVEDIAKLFLKDEYSIEVKDAITWYDVVNDKKQVDLEIAEDLIETGIGIKRMYPDFNMGTMKYRRVVPERCISNYFVKTDGSDIWRFGEYIDMTIADLKQWWPGQKEEVYREVASISANNKYEYPNPGTSNMSGYPWDKDKITVVDHVWFSSDDQVLLIKPDKNGNPRIFKQDYNFPNQNKKGEHISDEEYMKRHPDRKIMRKTIRNIYKCKWIVGTNYCFDYGLATNMVRTYTDYQETKLPYVVATTNFKSIMKYAKPVFDNIQINWLQFQNHVAKSVPAGFSVEQSAFENITLGKSRDRLQPKDVLRMFFDTGIMVWRRKNNSPSSNQFKPIEPMINGMSQAAAQHLEFITYNMNLLRDILGINEVEDASTPNPDILKGVAQMAAVGTNNALTTLYHAFDSISVRSAKLMADYTPDIGRQSESFRNVLGARSAEFWEKLAVKEMGISFEPGSDEAAKQRIHEYAKLSQQSGEIAVDHLLEIENEQNPLKKAQILRQRRKEYMAEKQKMSAQQAQQQNDINQNQIQASIQGEIQKIQAKSQGDMQVEQMKLQAQMSSSQILAQLETINKKMDYQQELTMEEKQLVSELTKIDRTKEWDLKISKSKPVNKPK